MNILNKIKKKWDFSKTVEQNCIKFSNEQEEKRKKINKSIIKVLALLFFFGIVVFLITGNPIFSVPFFIGAITYGSEYAFTGTGTYSASKITELDSTHFAVIYRNSAQKGIVKIGTVSSGNQITYGSEYEFSATNISDYAISFLDTTHFVIVYKDEGNSQYGTAIIGTVSSGNQISYGNKYVFNSGDTREVSVTKIDSSHFVVVYQDFSNSKYGTAIIGTVASVNQISYGSEYVFNSGETVYIGVLLLDSTHIVITYTDNSNGQYGTAIVGMITSVNQISYGSEYVFNSNISLYIKSISLDSSHFAITYNDSVLEKGTAIIGTVSSGNQITYGSKYEFKDSYTTSFCLSKVDSSNFILTYSKSSTANVSRICNVISGNQINYGDEYNFSTEELGGVNSSLIDSTHIVITYPDSDYSLVAIVGTFALPAAPGLIMMFE